MYMLKLAEDPGDLAQLNPDPILKALGSNSFFLHKMDASRVLTRFCPEYYSVKFSRPFSSRALLIAFINISLTFSIPVCFKLFLIRCFL